MLVRNIGPYPVSMRDPSGSFHTTDIPQYKPARYSEENGDKLVEAEQNKEVEVDPSVWEYNMKLPAFKEIAKYVKILEQAPVAEAETPKTEGKKRIAINDLIK